MHLKLRILLLCLLLGAATLPAQLSCGLKAGVGLSQITGYWRGENSTFWVIPSPSTSIGGYGQLGIGSRFLLRAELLGSIITDHYRSKSTFADENGIPTGGFSTVHVWRNVCYLSVPLMAGFRFEHFDLFLGVQGSLALKSWARDEGWIFFDSMVRGFDNKYPTMNVQPFDIGPKAAATYSLSDRFSLEMSYYHGLIAIQQARNAPWPFRVRQLLVGLNWRLGGKATKRLID
jgi:hypothetical protein